jgi:hypothetical protein
MSINRSELILNIFNGDNISNKYDATNYIKSKKLDKVKNYFSNKNIDDIISGINLFYLNDFKEKKLFSLYEIIVKDFCNNTQNITQNVIINKLIKKISLLDKGYILLNIIHNKYNLTNYASSILEFVLMKGTLTNLLFWKKIMTDKYIFTINNLILVVKNSDIRMLKYFIDNITNVIDYSYMNNILVSKILTSLMTSDYIPIKFKLKRLKMLSKIIDFNKHLGVMFNKIPLHIINNIYKYYDFNNYILRVKDLGKLQDSKSLINFYNQTNITNKNIISLLYLFRGYNLNTEILNNIDNIIKNKIDIKKNIIEMFCNFCTFGYGFYNRNSNKYNEKNYKLMTEIMKSQFSNVNYTVNLKFWDCILDYVYYILPFIKNIKLDIKSEDNFCKIEKSYNILKRFFNNIYYKRIKYNRMIKMLKTEEYYINNTHSINNIHSIINMRSINNPNYYCKYYTYYYDGIMTDSLPPNIYPKIDADFNFTDLKCIYLEDESLYLIIIEDLDLVYKHQYLIDNNIKLDFYNYETVLQNFIKENNNIPNKWFPLIILQNDISQSDISQSDINKQLIGFNKIGDLYQDKFIIFKNRENIYIKLKVVIECKSKGNYLKLVDYENNDYTEIKKVLQKIGDIDNLDNDNIIKYYPNKKDYEICYYSVKPNKKEKIDYLLNL